RDQRYHDTKDLARALVEYAEVTQPSRLVVAAPAAPQPAGLDVATMPLRPWAALPPLVLPGGTQLLSPAEPISSPLPGWRLEMRPALAARRGASMTQGAEMTAPLTQHPASDVAARPRERRGSAWIYATASVLLSAIGTLGLLLVIGRALSPPSPAPLVPLR